MQGFLVGPWFLRGGFSPSSRCAYRLLLPVCVRSGECWAGPGSAPAGSTHVGCSFRCGSVPVGARWARVQPQLAVRMSAAPSGVRAVPVVPGGPWFLSGPVVPGERFSPSWQCACPLLLPCACVPMVPRSGSAPAGGAHNRASFRWSAAMPDLASFSKHYRPMEGLWSVPEYFSCPSPADVRVDSRG